MNAPSTESGRTAMFRQAHQFQVRQLCRRHDHLPASWVKMCIRRNLPQDFSSRSNRPRTPGPGSRKPWPASTRNSAAGRSTGSKPKGSRSPMSARGVNASFKIDSVRHAVLVQRGDRMPGPRGAQAVVGNNGALRMTRDHRSVPLGCPIDPNDFKAKIPPDYQLIDQQQPGQGGGGFGRGAGMGSAGPPKSGQKST